MEQKKKLHAAHHHDVLALRNDLIRDGAFESAGRNCQEPVRRGELDVAAGQFRQLHRLCGDGDSGRYDAQAHRLQEDGACGRGNRFRRRGYPVSFGRSGQFPDLPDRRIRLGLLDVYAQHRRQPDAQYARRRRQEG